MACDGIERGIREGNLLRAAEDGGADETRRLHHGTLNAVLLPTILDFNRDHVGDKYMRLNAAMGREASADPAEFHSGVEPYHRAARRPAGDGRPAGRDAGPRGARHQRRLHVHGPRPCSAEDHRHPFEAALS